MQFARLPDLRGQRDALCWSERFHLVVSGVPEYSRGPLPLRGSLPLRGGAKMPLPYYRHPAYFSKLNYTNWHFKPAYQVGKRARQESLPNSLKSYLRSIPHQVLNLRRYSKELLISINRNSLLRSTTITCKQ